MSNNIQIFSDLHLDVNQDVFVGPIISDEADVIIFAGDLFNDAHKTVDFVHNLIHTLPDYQHVVYIFGNHEFYNCYMDEAYEYANSKQHPRVHFLERGKKVVIHDMLFFGDVFWTDFTSAGDPTFAMWHARNNMSDFTCIFQSKTSMSFIKPAQTVEWHEDCLKWFEECIFTSTQKHNIMVTHHAPCNRSVSPAYVGNLLNGAFVSPVLENNAFMDKVNIAIHGHVHTAFDYMAGDVRVICNPAGYMGFFGEGQDFSQTKIVRLDEEV